MEITESQWLNRMNNPVEEKRRQTEEHKQAYESLRFSNPEVMMTRFLPKDTISSIRPQKSNPSSSTTPSTPPISPEPPDPPDFNQSIMISVINDVPEKIKASSLSNPSSKTRRKKLAIPLRYSCDEIYERMTNGLCIFCEEQNTHDHQLKHKRYQIFVKECDDQRFDDEELVEPAVETSSVLLLPNGEDTLRSVIGFKVEAIETNSSAKEIGSSTVKDVIVTNLVQEEESSTEKQTKPEVFYLIEKFPYHQVLNYDWEQRRNNMLQSHIGMDLVVLPVKCDVDKLFVSKVLASANGKRPLDPGITKMFNKSLVCLGAHNKKFEAELEIYMHHNSTNQKLRVMYHCAEMESSWFKKLNEMGLSMSLQKNPELVTPLVKETQDWIVNAWPKIQVCYGFALASWNGLEIYGCKYKKQMLMLVKQCYRVWECGGFLATNIYLKLLEKLYKRVSVLNTRSRLFFFVSDGRISFTGLLSYCLEDLASKRLAYLVELKKVLWCGRNIGEGTTELNQYCLQICLQAKCYEAGFSILSDEIFEIDQSRDFLLYCYYHILCTFDMGKIRNRLKRFHKALELLYNVVTASLHLVNAIALAKTKVMHATQAVSDLVMLGLLGSDSWALNEVVISGYIRHWRVPFSLQGLLQASFPHKDRRQWLVQILLQHVHDRLKKHKLIKAWHFKYKQPAIMNSVEQGCIGFSGCPTYLKKQLAAMEWLSQEIFDELNKIIAGVQCLKHIYLQRVEVLTLTSLEYLFGIEQYVTSGLVKDDNWQAVYDWFMSLQESQAVPSCEEVDLVIKGEDNVPLVSTDSLTPIKDDNTVGPDAILYRKMFQHHNNSVTKVLTHWKEHPPDQTTWSFSQAHSDDQSRECGFYELLAQWKWYPP